LKKILVLIISLSLLICMMISSCDIKWLTNSPSISNLSGGGVLNLYSVDPSTLDPAISGDSTSAEYILQIFSGLLHLDDKLKIAGDIAKTWEISPDGLTYTFHLRQNVKFQDGRPLNAEDFKFSWERAANPDTKSQTALAYLGDIIGIKDILSGKTRDASGIKVLDKFTLQVTIDSPKSYLLYKLTYPTAFVVDKSNISSGTSWWHKPNGTGPFKLKQWTENKSLTLERNDSFYGEIAKISQINYQFYTGNPVDLFEKGAIDVTGVSTAYIDEVNDVNGQYYKELSISPAFSFYYIGFNCSVPPFDDVSIRKAFNLAIDKDKIISLVFKNMVQKAEGILPPGFPGYNQNLTGLDYNPIEAQQLIKSSKYGDISKLPPLSLTTSGYGGGISSTLQALVYEWKQNLGIDVQIRQLEPDYYFYNLQAEKDQMFEMGWNADYPHPQDFIDILFSTGANNNYGQYSNIDADTLIDQANLEPDFEKSILLYQQAEQIIVNDAACIPLTFDKNYLLVKPHVKGYIVNPLGFVSLDKVSLTSQ
jgi:oligopeptide transport system substrate-binding protein